MFGFMKGKKEDAEAPSAAGDDKQPPNPARRTSSDPVTATKPKPASKAALDDDDDDNWGRPPPKKPTKKDKDKFKNDFSDSGGLENQSVQDLENYAVYKAEETTNTVNNCRKIAENIKGDATKTLDMLHEQGEQIHRTHEQAVEMEKDLSKGEKLLGNLGGICSAPWKPKKKHLKGPQTHTDKPSKKASKEKKQKLLDKGKKGHSAPATPANEPVNANYAQIEAEKKRQDDGLEDLSNILGDLKGMAVDMGGELDRQNKALDDLGGDVDEINTRVKGANQRARKLLAK